MADKELRRNSELDNFKRELEDKVNENKPNRTEKESGLTNTRFYETSDPSTHAACTWNRHFGFLEVRAKGMIDFTTLSVTVCTSDEAMNGSPVRDRASMMLSQTPAAQIAWRAWCAGFRIATKENPELEGQPDPSLELLPFFHLTRTLTNVIQSRQQFVDFYDEIAKGMMRLDAYYIPRTPNSLIIPLGWQEREKIIEEYLTRKQSAIKMFDENTTQAHDIIRQLDKEN